MRTANKAITKQSQKRQYKAAVSNAVTLDPNNPIPFDYSGRALTFINRTEYLPFIGTDNKYAQKILEARLLSDTHNACINTKKDYCAGEGFQDKDNIEFDQSIIDWFSTINRRGESAIDINQQIFEDFFTWGNVPIELVRVKIGKKRFLYVYPHNFMEWRLCAPNDDDICDWAIHSKLFITQSIVNSKDFESAKKLPIYNPMRPDKDNWTKDDNGTERTLIWFKNKVTGIDHYGLPSSISSMIYQILEYKAARYNLDDFENNMVVASILALKGSLSDSEVTRIARQIIKTHTGDGKRGRTVVIGSEEGIDSSAFHKIDTKKDGSFNEADNNWMQKIILANQWDSVLAGLISSSTLGKGSGFITKILENKLNTVIKPAQRNLIEKVWKHIFKIAQEWMQLPFDKYSIEFKNSIDISGLTDVDITPAVKVNEVREAKGLPADPARENEYMPSKGGNNNVPTE
ncbi:hypothetical protein ACLOAU_14680 [Niabella sp. CJ426]|uniref:hypothetical protein n=1 Tax=Niabella sp. CJ426 TaxID=3393740 RepID=UPI003D07C415